MKTRSNKRVLMLVENQSYPQDVRVRREASALTAAGYIVSVICPSKPGLAFREVINGVRVFRYPPPSAANSFLAYLWEYAYSMMASFLLSMIVFFGEGFDVVHAHNPPDTFVFIAAFYKLFGKRFIFDHHDLSPEMYMARMPGGGNRFVYRALLLMEKLTYFFADHVITTNESYRNIEMERGGVPADRITIVRNGIPLTDARRAEPESTLLGKGKIIIGYVGVMGFQDGVDYLLRALHHLLHHLGRTDFHCVLVGTGDAWPKLRQLARQLGLEQYVSFTGFVSNQKMQGCLSAAQICVAPEPSNSFNDRSTMIKMLHYMSMSKPIVAFDLPEHRVTARDAALYARPNDELAFAKAILGLMDDPQRREALGASGRSRFESELAWEYSVPCLLEAYHCVLGQPKGSQPVLHPPKGAFNATPAPVTPKVSISSAKKEAARLS
jgi:glycosyltransferase involved in cell wall biosynthesis